jgi:hypothetical protein
MKFRHLTALYTDLNSEDCSRRLIASIDPESPTLFSLSGHSGSKPVIGRLDGDQFYLHKRRTWKNAYAPKCYGIFVTEGNGTLIECHFDLKRITKVFTNIWLAMAVLFGIPMFVLSFWNLLTHGPYADYGEYLSLFLPMLMIPTIFFLPKFGLWLSASDEEFILTLLRNNLAAKNCESNKHAVA